MAGLNLGASLFGGVGSATAPQYGSKQSYSSGASASSAAFGVDMTTPTYSAGETMKPNDGFGVAFWSGVVAVGLLVMIRKSLPN